MSNVCISITRGRDDPEGAAKNFSDVLDAFWQEDKICLVRQGFGELEALNYINKSSLTRMDLSQSAKVALLAAKHESKTLHVPCFVHPDKPAIRC